MRAPHSSSSVGQHASFELQDGFQVVSQRKVELPDLKPEHFEYWSQVKQEEAEQSFSFSSLVGDTGSIHQPGLPAPLGASDGIVPGSGYPPQTQNGRPSSHNASSQPWNPHASIDWKVSLDNFPSTPVTIVRSVENGRPLQQQHATPRHLQPGSIDNVGQAIPSLSHSSNNNVDLNGSSTPRPATSVGGNSSSGSDSSRLKDIQESIHCFWLVSENRMSEIQHELSHVSTRLKDSLEVQERIDKQASQILPLQVEITQKVVRAADDRKVILGRIKLLEDSFVAWQNEVSTMLEAMQDEFRAGLETMQELATKSKKPSAPRAKAEPTVPGAPIPTLAPAPTPATTSTLTSTATTNKSNKRISPPRKRTSPQGAKKVKVVSADDDDSSMLPAPSTPLIQEQIDVSHDSASQQPTDYDHHQQFQQQQQQQQHHQLSQPRPQTAGAWHHETRFQANSQPMVSKHRPSSSFDQIQLQSRPHTSVPCLHDLQQGIGSIEMAMHR